MGSEEIPFNKWSQDRIDQGRKICTSRHRRYAEDKRVTWISPKLPWWFIRDFLYRAEGADSPEELHNVIEDIYHRTVPDAEEFHVHFGDFRKVGSKGIDRCSRPGLHNFKNMNARTKCEWCGKTVGEVGVGL